MVEKHKIHNRQSIRIQGFDYASPGSYFVTIVSHQRSNIFGEVLHGEVKLSPVGKVVERKWQEIPSHFKNISLDVFVIMPNHIHGILNINERSDEEAHFRSFTIDDVAVLNDPGFPKGPKPQSLGAIIGLFKSAVTKKIHELCLLENEKVWQRNYYEHIIWDDEDLNQIIDYIETNPDNWEADTEYNSEICI